MTQSPTLPPSSPSLELGPLPKTYASDMDMDMDANPSGSQSQTAPKTAPRRPLSKYTDLSFTSMGPSCVTRNNECETTGTDIRATCDFCYLYHYPCRPHSERPSSDATTTANPTPTNPPPVTLFNVQPRTPLPSIPHPQDLPLSYHTRGIANRRPPVIPSKTQGTPSTAPPFPQTSPDTPRKKKGGRIRDFELGVFEEERTVYDNCAYEPKIV
ncbi:hypothetical protein AMATHDRAFT_6291 [Amanita thiersii Skay4041]|uniref:Uncharacterized protein n=1 Tax=Amanita thiersii Skay4041 TaxID=703135 RepID=A0A2A9NJQ8_9AGAR|nr:hypothetical protein AMATHDRAFT_6291 [Amanita thiersii Skay4041]